METMNNYNYKLVHKDISRNNISYFGWYYCGLTTPDHQRKWDKVVQGPRFCILSAREHGKSTSRERLYPLHKSLFVPDIRILMVTKTATLSLKRLNQIYKDMRNKRIRADFAEESLDLNKVGNTLTVNRKDSSVLEATITALGVGGSPPGEHYDIILLGDIVDILNTKTKSSRQFIIDWVNTTIEGFLPPDGVVFAIGNRKHPQDVYQYFVENPTWKYLIEKAIIKFPESYEYIYEMHNNKKIAIDVKIKGDYKVLWEDPSCKYAWGIKSLLLKKLAMGKMFDLEFQNDASAGSGNLFETDWLHFYTTDLNRVTDNIILMPRVIKEIVQGWDFAIGKDEENDFTVCCTCYVDYQNRVFAKFYRDKIDFPTACDMVQKLYYRDMPRIVVMEANQFQKGYRQTVSGYIVFPHEDVVQTTDKILRLNPLGVFFKNGTIYVDIDDNLFFDEYRAFQRNCQHEDQLDALKLCMDKIVVPEEKKFPGWYVGK